jgi:hypothetical protein
MEIRDVMGMISHMAFTGSPVVKQVSDSIVRITGVSLTAGANGTIGLDGATGAAPGIRLPDAFDPQPYGYGGQTVSLSDMLDVTTKPADTTNPESVPISVVKTGTTVADWRCTITNTFASVSPGLEIYVKLHE